MELWRCSTVGRLLWVNSARQGAAWQTGVLCDCQQEPPQIVWEPVCFFKLTIYYIYPSVCAEYIYKRRGVFSCLDDCLWTSSLPYPVFLSAVMSTSQRANRRSVMHRMVETICLSALLVLPPAYWKILSLRRTNIANCVQTQWVWILIIAF